MKWRLTYKELSVMLGILVALIIVFAIWMRQKPNTEFPVSSRLKMPSVSVPAATKAILKKALSAIKF